MKQDKIFPEEMSGVNIIAINVATAPPDSVDYHVNIDQDFIDGLKKRRIEFRREIAKHIVFVLKDSLEKSLDIQVQ